MEAFEQLIEQIAPNLYAYRDRFFTSFAATFEMFAKAGIIAFVVGLFFGVLLVITRKGGVRQNLVVYQIVNIVINVFRSIPFIILLIFLIPLTRAVVGSAIGVKGAILPLVFGTVPFYTRQVEVALTGVNEGKVEAARSMGSGTLGLIFRVYLHEAVPELIRVTTVTAISLIGLTTMAGTVGAGGCNISLGTSGTIFISSDKFGVDPNNALHAFAHADGGYHLMGCMLSAASCNKWLCEEILKTSDFAGEQADITDEKLGENHVYFLPYLMGERSPINDTNARGTFTGMTMDTSRSDMVQAVLEGVAFAIRDSFEVAKSLGIDIPRSNVCGGGAKSPLWRRIFANVLGIPLDMVKTEQGPGYGAAMLAMVGCGKFASVQEAADALVETASTTEPAAALTAKYEARYQNFKKLYPALKGFFAATV